MDRTFCSPTLRRHSRESRNQVSGNIAELPSSPANAGHPVITASRERKKGVRTKSCACRITLFAGDDNGENDDVENQTLGAVHHMSEEATAALAEFAASLTYAAIPERLRDRCKDLLLDALACAVAGHAGEETHQVAALSSALAQSRESTVIGGDRLSLAGATMLNGYLITAVTMCDAHRSTMTHITPEVVPPALAIAERDALSGGDLLVALVAGSEVTTRIGIGVDFPAFRARGWHGPGIFGPFGAAAAVGRLLHFDAETMARAFGLAGSQAAGTFAAWGTPTVKFHQCRGALSGLMAALLAEEKFLATHEFLTAKDGGLYNSYSNGGKPELATADLGQRWELEQIALRLGPC